MRSLPVLVAAGLVLLGGFAAGFVASSPFGSLGRALTGEIPSAEALASAPPTPNSGSGTEVVTISVGQGPSDVGYNSGNGYVYVPHYYSNNVSVINGTKVVATVPGTFPQGVGDNSGNGYVYITNVETDTVSVVNGTTVVATVRAADDPIPEAYHEATGD